MRDSWRIDAVAFTADGTRCIMLTVKVDLDPAATMDYAIYYAGESRERVWYFYGAGPLPTIGFPREFNGNKPFTLKRLSVIGREEVVGGGYFRAGTCEINDAYIHEWFRPELYEAQRRRRAKVRVK